LVDFEDLAKERKQRLDSFLKSEFQSVAASRLMVEGDPARMITEYADRHNVDLIMMPTHGYGPFRRFLLGSITAKVLHDVKCPVWTSAHLPERAAPPAGYRNVLCAVDLREESVSEIRWAADLANSYGAQLTLVHAIPAAASPTPPDENRFRHHLLETARAYIADLQRKAGTTARVCIEGGKIARTVRNAALQHAADLVVIGQGCAHEVLGRLRSNAYAIIRESPCPVVRA
jgi:nucleotide-binding universal stress UspA family protein